MNLRNSRSYCNFVAFLMNWKNKKVKDNKMKVFLDANPGIKSRINSTIYFESYTPEEMVSIVHRQAENMQYVLDNNADGAILEYFRERTQKRDFGNGREARSLVEQCMTFAARRVMGISEKRITKKMMKENAQFVVNLLISSMQ